MHLYLHIGAEKTGTSAIQRFLQINRARLLANDVLFPRAPGDENHMALAAAAQDDAKRDDLRHLYRLASTEAIEQFRKRLQAALWNEIGAASPSKVILSGEHCSSRLISEAEIERLRGMLQPLFDEITVVLYVRRQDELLSSHYSTWLKTGYTDDLELPDADERDSYYDYWSMASRWASVFGRHRLVVRRYQPRWLVDGDAVDDFCSVAGIDPPSEASGYKRPPRLNESLDATACAFLRRFNALMPRFVTDGVNPARGDIESMLADVGRGPVLSLAPRALEAFVASFRSSNARVAEEFFGGALDEPGDPLFGGRDDGRARTDHAELSLDAAMRIFAELWTRKQSEVLGLRRQVIALRREMNASRGDAPRNLRPPG